MSGTGPPERVRREIDLPCHSGGGLGMLALVQGELGGSDGVEGGCVWLGSGGDPADAAPLVWPPGYRARYRPLEVLDAGGDVVARAGDVMSFGGGLARVVARAGDVALAE